MTIRLNTSAESLNLVSPEQFNGHDSGENRSTALVENATPVIPFRCSIEADNVLLAYPVAPFRKGSVKSAIMGLFGAREKKAPTEMVPALRYMKFSINHGERVGIIGQNGSGKSSLLRALAGIYPLFSGEIRIRGRIGTLLDISLGFELESTGRENIYYRGYAMGLTKKELREMEDEIVAFANIGEFIDLPMRTYSSGMFVRLGFAISTQWTPDILLIDEVFSAGDARFAAKAQKRMAGLTESAGIVVMVSHDVQVVQRSCTRVLWIHDGRLRFDGPSEEAVARYLKASEQEE